MDKLLTVEEVAQYLGVAVTTVYRWLWSKKIKGIKVGPQWRIPESFLAEFIDPKIKSEG